MWEEIGDSVGVNKVAAGIPYPQRIQIRSRGGDETIAIGVFDHGLEDDAGVGGEVALFEDGQREGVLPGGKLFSGAGQLGAADEDCVEAVKVGDFVGTVAA